MGPVALPVLCSLSSKILSSATLIIHSFRLTLMASIDQYARRAEDGDGFNIFSTTSHKEFITHGQGTLQYRDRKTRERKHSLGVNI